MRKQIQNTKNYAGRKITITTDAKTQNLVDEFMATLESDKSPRTITEYRRVAIQVLNARKKSQKINITSKAKWLQCKAVITRMRNEGILSEDEKVYGFSKQWKSKNSAGNTTQEKVLSESTFHHVLSVLPDDDRGRELKRLCEISFYFGLRLEEALHVLPDDFDTTITTKGTVWFLRVGSEHAKGNKARLVPVLKKHESRCMDILTHHARAFTITRNYVMYEFKKAVRIVDGADSKLTFHCLRHSFATHYDGEIDLLQKLLGHADITTTIKYYRHTKVLDDNALAQYGY